MALQQFIPANYGRFLDENTEHPHPATDRNLAGYRSSRDGEYWLLPEGFAEACGGSNAEDVARELRNRGLLNNEKGRLTARRRIKLNGKPSRPTVFAVSDEIVQHDFTGKCTNVDTDGAGGTSSLSEVN